MNRTCLVILVASFASAVAHSADPQPVPPETMPALKPSERVPKMAAGLPMRFQTGFEGGSLDVFEPTDTKAWKVVEQGGNHVYALVVRQSDYKPPQRSPYNIALVKGLDAGSVVVDVRLQSAMTDYGHRSLCLFFNHLDPSHFYYVHFGKEADPHANQIFIVNGADRKAISKTTTAGTPWDDQWHHARVVRDADTGDISVFFDDMTKPVMTAVDKTFTSGRVGVGSFDDAGNFDELVVYTKDKANE
ncbi:MAG: hypothetical protein M3552_20960 [Planctomycetota bacterium]|nr:hypothetical protein [Planctomycetaceae bacterium]MDQ3333086.1 hypothetical protein [Planctomycetota bacterium]